MPDNDPTGEVECGPKSCGGGACPLRKRITADPAWDFLNKPTNGGLTGSIHQRFFLNPDLPIKEPFLVYLSDTSGVYVLATIFLEFKDGASFSRVVGLFGCTSVLVTSQCGMYIVKALTL